VVHMCGKIEMIVVTSISCCALLGCSAIRTINYSGVITKKSVDQVIDLIADGRRSKLLIRSTGGDGEAAVLLAEAVSKHNVAVEAYDYCISGCTLVFVASKKRTLQENTALLFHWGANYNHRILNAEIGANAVETKRAKLLAQRESNIYLKGGIKEWMIDDTIRILSPVCSGALEEKGEFEAYSITSLRSILFDQAQLIEYGFLQSEIVNSYNDERAFGARAQSKPEWGNIGFVRDVASDSIPLSFSSLPDCTNEQKQILKDARTSYYKAVKPPQE
jgi:hypothetical protein